MEHRSLNRPAMDQPAGSASVLSYSPAMQALHWLVAALMFAVLPLAWTMTSVPRAAPDRELLFTLHKSVGITILVLMAIRIGLRASRPTPAEPAGTPGWMAACAVASHWLLYAVLFIMPISGYVLSTAGGNPVWYFGLFTLPAFPPDHSLEALGRSVHHAVQWAVYALVGVHLLATGWHVVVRRDALLDRQLPAQRR
jgi:cytochrome b561